MTALFVAPDAYRTPTIWRRDSDDDRLPQPILSRTAANARGFDALAALVEGAAS